MRQTNAEKAKKKRTAQEETEPGHNVIRTSLRLNFVKAHDCAYKFKPVLWQKQLCNTQSLTTPHAKTSQRGTENCDTLQGN